MNLDGKNRDLILPINNENNVGYVEVEKITVDQDETFIVDEDIEKIESFRDINIDNDNMFVFIVEKGASIYHIENRLQIEENQLESFINLWRNNNEYRSYFERKTLSF